MAEHRRKLPVDPTIISRARELRRAATPAERNLWSALRGKQLYGLRFRRQHPLPPYIVDFYYHEKRLVVELDGGQHNEAVRTAYDHDRTAWLQPQGLRVMRFWNREVDTNLEGVLEAIAKACGVEVD
ncbi:MAG: endonuclease domain-containing protein [Anaerolineae bacterium]|nr:endonuclease domain-containing protein [Anaerolineae bacterium]